MAAANNSNYSNNMDDWYIPSYQEQVEAIQSNPFVEALLDSLEK